MTPWEIDAVELANCNCAFGCPCQFNSLPTHGLCEAAAGFIIHRGFHGGTRLDGLKAAFIAHWPGAIHQGNGTMQMVIDERASPAQRAALQSIFTGGDTEDMATVFWVFHKMSPNQLETLYRPIDAAIDLETRTGHVRVPGVFRLAAEPIRNPVTGVEARSRINLPSGFEFRQAEVASGTTETEGAIRLDHNKATHAHFARIYMNGHGVIDHAA